MKKRLFYAVASWFAPTDGFNREVFIRHAYTTAASETEVTP